MAELADAQDLGSCEAIRVGSTPTIRTRLSLDAIRVPGSVFYFAFSLAFMAGIFFVNASHTCGEQVAHRRCFFYFA